MRRAAAAGALAVLVAIGVAEALTAVLPGASSPLDAVGQQVVAWLPGGVLTWAIDTFGGANRAVLAGTSLVVALAGGAAIGVAGRRSFAVPLLVVGAVGLAAILATLAQPGTALPTVLIAVVAAAVAGLVTLYGLRRSASAAPAGSVEHPAAVASPTDPPVERRSFLRLAVVAGAVGVGGGVFGRVVTAGEGGVGVVDPSRVSIPAAGRPLPPVAGQEDLAAGLDGATPLFTPNDDFFRIDTAIAVPRVSPDGWSLRIHGRVDEEFELTYEDLLGRPLHEVDATISCVSNEVGGDLIGTARWTGVPLRDLLEEAGVRADAEQVLGRSVDGWTGGFPIEVAMASREPLVAVAMNGEPLPVRHGFPARLVVPGLFGYVSATKWLADIELTAWDGVDGYWVPRGWAKEGPVKTASRIDLPAEGARLGSGELTLAGVAWAPTRGIEQVEVRVDDGTWTRTELVPAPSAATWRQWHLRIELPPGAHRAQVRATDGDGRLQPEGPADPAPDGAEGWHARTFEVA